MVKEAEYWRTLDSDGRTMPWYTRPTCAWMDTLDFTGKSVWEYGGGVSTLWYRDRGAKVSGVDTSLEWANLSGLMFIQEKQAYISAISGIYDFICIDGEYRDDCFIYAINHLAEGGTIIIDNWKQASAWGADWPESERLIKELNLKVTEYPQEGHPDWVTITVTR